MFGIRDNEVKYSAVVKVSLADDILTVKGPKGEDSLALINCIDLEFADNKILVKLKDATQKEDVKFQGLYRTLIANMCQGVVTPFTKEIVLNGVAYTAAITGGGKSLDLKLGLSHPVVVAIPEGITVELSDKKGKGFIIKGVNKGKVGQFAADVRKFRPPEPYKGHGILFKNERIRRKQGKKKK